MESLDQKVSTVYNEKFISREYFFQLEIKLMFKINYFWINPQAAEIKSLENKWKKPILIICLVP